MGPRRECRAGTRDLGDTKGLCDPFVSGRLAQLVEHLLYTQEVAGSSPAPPIRRTSLTERRSFFSGASKRANGVMLADSICAHLCPISAPNEPVHAGAGVASKRLDVIVLGSPPEPHGPRCSACSASTTSVSSSKASAISRTKVILKTRFRSALVASATSSSRRRASSLESPCAPLPRRPSTSPASRPAGAARSSRECGLTTGAAAQSARLADCRARDAIRLRG